RRLHANEIHATGVLWGKGAATVGLEALALEQATLNAYPELAQGLSAADVDLDRRPLRVNVADLHWQFIADDVLQLSFGLPAGSYATAVLREIITC
ncbi:MAG: tRNA pseudouridine(13) synthase TruD, partial [Methylococcales bacterium]